jgi:rare lipoprotein A
LKTKALCTTFVLILCSHIAMAGAASKQTTVVDKKNAKGQFKLGSSYVISGKKYTPKIDKNYSAVGKASWYGKEFGGRKTANGTIFTGKGFTAAHRTLPLPSVVSVTNLKNGKVLEVLVNDRGPFNHRIIDLSHDAAKELGFAKEGETKVKIEYLHDKTMALLALYPPGEHKKAIEAFKMAQKESDSQKVIR